MIEVSFTPETIQELHHQRFHHPHPHVRLKMEAIYLKSQGLKHKDVAALCNINHKTFERYLKQYRDGGITALATVKVYRPKSELEAHKDKLEGAFRAKPPTTVAEAALRIKELTGLERKPTQVRVFLKKLGMKPLKTAGIPAKADVQAQESFKKKALSHA